LSCFSFVFLLKRSKNIRGSGHAANDAVSHVSEHGPTGGSESGNVEKHDGSDEASPIKEKTQPKRRLSCMTWTQLDQLMGWNLEGKENPDRVLEPHKTIRKNKTKRIANVTFIFF